VASEADGPPRSHQVPTAVIAAAAIASIAITHRLRRRAAVDFQCAPARARSQFSAFPPPVSAPGSDDYSS
jgi:hypothetical protein